MKLGIAGAGIMGRVLAFRLVQEGHHVTIFDKHESCYRATASQMAAGMLAPYAELENMHADILTLSCNSIVQWKSILSKLNQQALLIQRGSLLVASESEISELLHFKKRAESWGVMLELIENAQLGKYEPEFLGGAFHGIWIENEAVINSYGIMDSLFYHLKAHASFCEQEEVQKIKDHCIYTDKKQQVFDCVFDCRGMGAQKDLKYLRGVRGEALILQAPDVNFTRPIRLLHPRYALYVVPQAKNHYFLGATQIESQDDSPVSVQSCLELLSAAYSIHPGFAEARIIEMRAQCRPAFHDNLPKIIKTKDCIHINGMYRHGFLLSPGLAEQAVQSLRGEDVHLG